MKRFFRGISLAVGLALLAWFIHRAGPAEIWKTCASLGFWAPLLLLPYALVYASDTLGWRFASAPGVLKGIRFGTLYRIRWCGEAVNSVIPSAYVGGETVKVLLLGRRGIPSPDATASVIIGRTAQTLTQVLFVALGAAAFVQVGQQSPEVRRGLILVTIAGGIAVAILFWIQTRGLFSLMLGIPVRLGLRLKALDRCRETLLEMDRKVATFYRDHRGRFLTSSCFYLGGWMLDTLELFLVGALVGMPMEWPQALAVESFIGVAKVVGLLVPGALGVQETGIALACRLAGLPDALGFSYAILRRARELLFAAGGWLLLHAEGPASRDITIPSLIPTTPP